MDKNVNICLICDDGYVVPASVAMTSMVETKNADTIYNFFIVCASLTEESEKIFKTFESETVTVTTIRQDASCFAGLHTVNAGETCDGTPAEFLKFILPEVIPCDKLLYLDCDLLVKEDLSEVFNTELDDNYLAAVVDSAVLYDEKLNTYSLQDYFNVGVMLLNLDLMRRDRLSEVFINKKTDIDESALQCQNIYNYVCDKKVVTLPIRYNFMPVTLLRETGKWTLEQINQRFGTEYKDEGQLFSDAAIIHFSSKDKPWKDDTVAFADDWYRCYLKAPVEHTLERSNQAPEDETSPKVSVIVPVYNDEKYVGKTLDSVINQTLKDIEIVVIDDGSTDNSLSVVQNIARKDSRIKVYHKENQGLGATRNFGIRKATGKYLFFLDSDDLIDVDTLQKCYEVAQWNNLDIVAFEAESFFDDGMKFDQDLWDKYKSLYHRKKYYPDICSGEKMYYTLTSEWGFVVQACMKMYARKYIVENDIFFPEGILHEDCFFAVKAFIEAGRVKVLGDSFYKRRLRESSIMTSTSNAYKKFVGYHESACKLLEYVASKNLDENILHAVAFRIDQWFGFAYEIYNEKLSEEEKAFMYTDPVVTRITYPLMEKVFKLFKTDFFKYHALKPDFNGANNAGYISFMRQIDELKKEKAERYHANLAQMKEKNEKISTLNAKVKELEEVKVERFNIINSLNEDKATLNAKVKELEELKVERFNTIKSLNEDKATLNAKVKELEQLKVERFNIIQQLKKDNTQQKNDFNMKEKQLQNNIGALSAEKQKLESDLQKLNAEKAKQKEKYEAELESIRNSLSFRIGRIITFIPRKIAGLFKK